MKFYLFVKLRENEAIVKDYLSKIGEITHSIEDCDVIVSVGGDGSLLRMGQTAIEYDKPIVGINAGHLGYLCAYKLSDIQNLTIEDFKNLKETKRTLVEYAGEIGINEVCVLKENPIKSIEFSVKDIASWRGDGVIISTATGSSSYNQAAGGPIIDPLSTDLIVTPICPHFAKEGPKVVKDNEVVIEVSERTPAIVTVDNRVIGPVYQPVVVKRSKKFLRLLTK